MCSSDLLQDKDYLVEVIDSIPNKKNLQYNLFRHRLYNFIPINIYFTELLCQLKKNRYKNNKKKKFKDLKRFFIHLKNFTSSKNFLNSKRYKTSLRRRYQVKRGKKRLKLSKEELALNYITIINLLKKKTRFEPSNETEIKDINEKRTRKKERVNKKPKKYFNYCKLFFRYTGQPLLINGCIASHSMAWHSNTLCQMDMCGPFHPTQDQRENVIGTTSGR